MSSGRLTSVGVDRAGDGGAVAILDRERAGLLRSRRGLRRSVLALGAAGRAGARRRRDPKVGRTGVEVDEEVLAGGANGDRARPLEVVLLVGEGFGLTLDEVSGEGDEVLDEGARLEDVRANILLKVDQVRAVLARGMSALLKAGWRETGVLDRVHRLNDSLVVVEGAILVLEGAALPEGNADALLRRDRGRGSHEAEGDGEQRSLAEHDECREKRFEDREASKGCREQELSW